ncbi:MAG: GDP-fucose synthetase [Ignavibacteria bacterium CG2_30_36_16]|nr:GDP-L-fucose synthase [Ignavibacteria bacterium]OIP59365.1 MAG: GDP-fucose synthetase [Ignavibacteria bacterium CG2_30_36_16]PJA99950.1 MAG: GDP-fucose synthetase [Ignavibacteria bacterium CG_4_9_14_3_um_filter_36_18]
MNKTSRLYLAGHKGMVGSAIYRNLIANGYTNLIVKNLEELDLIRQADVEDFFAEEKPAAVIVAAAKVGGILANSTYRAEFIYENIMIQNNIIHSAYKNGAAKLVFLGSSCIYPKLAPQPLKEEYLLSGYLEPTNEPYAIAKIAGIKMCENYYRQYGCNYISAMPTNLFGPYDNFNLETSHVLPALIRKFHEAKTNRNGSVELWGTGTPKREFLYVEDLADGIRFLLENVDAKDLYDNGISQINIGTGEDLTIKELADVIADVVGYKGSITYDTTKPDGTPRKLLDVSRIHQLGWHHKTSLREGIEKAYKWFVER